jgi:hypothetical protein
VILALYIIGAAAAILVLASRLHETRAALAQARRERDALAHAIETSMLASLMAGRPGQVQLSRSADEQAGQ